MNLRRLIGHLLAILVIVGLVIAPLVTPAAAKRLPVAEMTGMAAMSGDMPCCPDEQNKKSCPDCLPPLPPSPPLAPGRPPQPTAPDAPPDRRPHAVWRGGERTQQA